jgi:hypothetical protein
MQICKFLEIDVAEFDDKRDAKLRRDLEKAFWVLWDGTESDAEECNLWRSILAGKRASIILSIPVQSFAGLTLRYFKFRRSRESD